jgi:hypothetical protein
VKRNSHQIDLARAALDRLVSRPELGERWDYSLATLKRLEKTILRPLRIGGQVRYRLSDIVHAEQEAEIDPA